MNKFVAFKEKHGIALDKIGINSYAFDKKNALKAISYLIGIGKPILGGDVYIIKNNNIEITHDSWFCERREKETECNFLERSSKYAIEYICNYPIHKNVLSAFDIIY